MQTWIGTSGYQYPEWKGSFYPETLSPKKMLAYYSERLSSTEVNYTFRSIPSENAIATWMNDTPSAFRFSFKAPQQVTHFARLKNCADKVAALWNAISRTDEKFGAVLFQLPPNFKKDAALLDEFLASLPKKLSAAFEFRHASWFDDPVLDILRQHKTALCIAQSEDLETPPVATANFGYLRLRREDYKTSNLKSWAGFVAEQSCRWKDAFIYFKHEETGSGPKFAAQFKKLLESPT